MYEEISDASGLTTAALYILSYITANLWCGELTWQLSSITYRPVHISQSDLISNGFELYNYMVKKEVQVNTNIATIASYMLNKTPRVQKKARPIRSSSNLTMYIAILATKNFDIKLRPRIS